MPNPNPKPKPDRASCSLRLARWFASHSQGPGVSGSSSKAAAPRPLLRVRVRVRDQRLGLGSWSGLGIANPNLNHNPNLVAPLGPHRRAGVHEPRVDLSQISARSRLDLAEARLPRASRLGLRVAPLDVARNLEAHLDLAGEIARRGASTARRDAPRLGALRLLEVGERDAPRKALEGLSAAPG